MTDEDRSIFDQIFSAYSTLRVFYDESQNNGNWNMNKVRVKIQPHGYNNKKVPPPHFFQL
jgi:hypothetical protein